MAYLASGTLPVRASNLHGTHILEKAGQYVLGMVKVSYSYSICMNSDQRNQGQLFVSWRFRCQYGMRSFQEHHDALTGSGGGGHQSF